MVTARLCKTRRLGDKAGCLCISLHRAVGGRGHCVRRGARRVQCGCGARVLLGAGGVSALTRDKLLGGPARRRWLPRGHETEEEERVGSATRADVRGVATRWQEELTGLVTI
ncbi:unnamed protein product [Lampetra fluviatilis]